MIKCEAGKRYRTKYLVCIGWMCTAGTVPDVRGYHWGDYFEADGTFRGPDLHGVYPVFNRNVINTDPSVSHEIE
ncbi:MAG: hypothetical protein GTN64_05525 [Candidatus Latescibacteria bacterium]|nr:hypothetical protein [Candidatus Latescibacterota bacterium]NIO78069.1 hypothetical protein [Candidatus Latescibacterota bacterium]